MNGKDYRYLIGIKHLIGNPVFPPEILEREMFLIEKDYRETLFRELKKNKKITIELINIKRLAFVKDRSIPEISISSF